MLSVSNRSSGNCAFTSVNRSYYGTTDDYKNGPKSRKKALTTFLSRINSLAQDPPKTQFVLRSPSSLLALTGALLADALTLDVTDPGEYQLPTSKHPRRC